MQPRLSLPGVLPAIVCCVLVFQVIGLAAENALSRRETAEGWQLLFDGKTLNGWAARGPSRWAVRDGALCYEPGSGGGFLATTNVFSNYELKVEFWIDEVANSGVFLRCPMAGEIGATNAYEVNIFDAHDQWPTGSINEVAAAKGSQRTVRRWNTFKIRAEGDHLVVRLNGVVTVDARDGRFKRGVIALQNLKGEGMVRFRNLKLKPIFAERATPERRGGAR